MFNHSVQPPCHSPCLCVLTSSTCVCLLLSFTHLSPGLISYLSPLPLLPKASSHCTTSSLFTVLTYNHPISLLLPPPLRPLLISSSAPPSCPPYYGSVSVVTAIINQPILNWVEPCNPEHPPRLSQEVFYSLAVHKAKQDKTRA